MAIDFSEAIVSIVQRERGRLLAMKEEDVSVKPAPDKWSKKEIVGHLIDSACNNHQRFIRAQFTDRLDFPGYTGTDWVHCQGYSDENWQHLVLLWSAFNLHLAHVISLIPSNKMFVQCKIGENNLMSLEVLIADYIRHMEHHLKQLNPVSALTI